MNLCSCSTDLSLSGRGSNLGRIERLDRKDADGGGRGARRGRRTLPRVFLGLLLGAYIFSPAPARADCPPIPPSEYWKNTFDFPDDPFRVPGATSDLPDWVKFTILACDPNVVYFQDSVEYPFHFHFGTELLAPIFGGMSQSEYNDATLHETGQLGFLGALILPPSNVWPPPPQIPEYGIQLIRHDPYTREEVRDMFAVIRAAVNADPGVQAFYFPTPEQMAAAVAESEWFAQQDPPIIIGNSARWSTNNVVYSNGWALGQLKFFEGDDIEDAYQAGLLTPDDILLTDLVPSEIPFVAGVICLEPSTPNSHVALLANTFSIPFTFLALADDALLAQDLVGRRIALRAYDDWDGMSVRLIDAESLTMQQVEEILVLKAPQPIDFAPTVPYGAYSAPTAPLMPDDIQYFGGKAANFGMLRRTIPGASPVAAALSFDLWDAFMDQTMPGGDTLREEIAAILANHPTYPPDMAALADDLDDIRDMIKDDTVFSSELEQAVFDTLQDPQYGFNGDMKIRFRSSTNVEDSEHFTGAGLYDSYSGCLADDLDGDDEGPSICDPSKENERGVFRAIRKVFASFYNDNAFLERLRHGVDESQVGMAVLVHHSFPDEIELANGVATLEKVSEYWYDITLVTQYGAVSVTNPEGGAVAEEVDVRIYSGSIYPTIVRYSNLLPLGTPVLDWQAEYIELVEYLLLAADEFEAVTGKDRFVLDFEYKKVAPGGGALPAGGLVVKQIREMPQPSNAETITPFLLDEPSHYVIEQGEFGDVNTYHRLKSHWLLTTKNMWLTEENLQQSFHEDSALVYLEDCRLGMLTGAPSSWPDASYYYEASSWGGRAFDSWSLPDLVTPRRYELETFNIDTLVAPSESPILTVRDFVHILTAAYEEGVWDEQAPLMLACGELLGEWRQDRTMRGEIEELGGLEVRIDSTFYWPPEPQMAGGYTAPLTRWDQTVITGLTSEPVVLRDFYSQTYQPTHHNITEFFIFEPRLEAGISQSILDELEDLDVRLIHVEADHFGEDAVMNVFGYDGAECDLPGDLDFDGDVDLADLAILLAAYGHCFGESEFNPNADFTHNNCVDLPDLATLLAHYGAGT